MTKRERYQQIAAKYTPPDVKVIPVNKLGQSHGGRSHFDTLEMEVPPPTTELRLWTYLHECCHFRLHRQVVFYPGDTARYEVEAEQEVMAILDQEGIPISARVYGQQWAILRTLAINEGCLETDRQVQACLLKLKERAMRVK